MQLSAEQISRTEDYLRSTQNVICQAFSQLDGAQQFLSEKWEYSAGSGGGDSRVLESGEVFEKAGVNFSSIEGAQLPAAATESREHAKDRWFHACGISVVVHPLNPYVPTCHMNLRFIRLENDHWWFGGGFDLTPYYGFKQDAIQWHQNAQAACRGFGDGLYAKLKENCDKYFYIKHRGEARGIGGIFFDDFSCGGFENSFAFVQSVGKHFLKAYLPIVERRVSTPYGEREREFQLMRRGRYVEFNLVYDRGTLFGLQSGGRTESILMSLPPRVAWHYDFKASPDSAEGQLLTDYLKARDWLSEISES